MSSGTALSATTVSITSPADGSTHSAGFTGPLAVDFSAADSGTYGLAITGNGYSWEASYSFDGSNPDASLPFDPINLAGTYQATVTAPDATVAASVSFSVQGVDSATITSPRPNSSHLARYAGPLSAHFASIHDPGDRYSVVLRRNGRPIATLCAVSGADVVGSTLRCRLPKLRHGSYTAVLENATLASALATAKFTVVQLRASLHSLAAKTFYPLERDGYRDSVKLSFVINWNASDTLEIYSRRGRRIARVRLGRLREGRAHIAIWRGRNARGRLVKPGSYRLRIRAAVGSHSARSAFERVRVRRLPLRIRAVSVAPRRITPYNHDGRRDRAVFRFSTSRKAVDRIEITNRAGARVRNVELGALGGHRGHSFRWGGTDDTGRLLAPGTYRIGVFAKTRFHQSARSAWLRVTLHRPSAPPPTHRCTPGYSPCLVWHGGADYDCYGGDGNGPYYTAPGVVYTVTGSDPYDLDGNNNGRGCEANG